MSRFNLALRLRRLVLPIGGGSKWVEQAVAALRRHVFGIADGGRSPVTSWDPETLRARVSWLNDIDGPLRGCLETAKDRKLVFEKLYLPLSRVRGFLKAVRVGPPDWPHLAWTTRVGDRSECRERSAAIFQALQVDVDLDAEDAVFDLAQADLKLRRPDGSAWDVEPDQVFAGHWGTNANRRVWKRLLDEEPPREGGAWRLEPIARRAVEGIGREPAGRTGLPSGARPGPPGAVDDGDVAWAANLVTAEEWQSHRFLDAEGKSLSLSGCLVPQKTAQTPFAFQVPAEAISRKVDGRLRFPLLARLEDGMAREAASLAAPRRAARLIQLAEIAALLPNHTENLDGPPERLDQAHLIRQRIYGALNQALGEPLDGATRTELFRQLMRLHVANRENAPLLPAFKSVAERLAGEATLGTGWNDVRSEQMDLQSLLDRAADSGLDAARAGVDAALEALRPRGWGRGESALRNLDFHSALGKLGDYQIGRLLQLRKDLRTILKAQGPQGAPDRAEAGDLDRLWKVFDLIDAHIWYSRHPQFQPGEYLTIRKDGPNPWWPALVVLAWADADVQEAALDWCDRAEGQAGVDENTRERVADLRRMVFQLDEATFATLSALRARPKSEAEAMLTFHHESARQAMNFRLLAQTTTPPEEISARALAQNGFRCILILLRIAGHGPSRSNEAVHQRLFGSLDAWLPEGRRRIDSIKDLNVDTAVKLAAELADSGWAPDPLKEGAEDFLKNGSRDLLTGAETAEGVFDLVMEIRDRCHAGSPPRYRKFYETALLAPENSGQGQVRLSDELARALAEPFFTRSIPGQRQSIEGLLRLWRKLPAARGSDLAIGTALKADFGRIVVGLVRGERQLKGGRYLWKPAEDLRAPGKPLDKAPEEFLDLARWWIGLAQPGDPPEFSQLFALEGNAVPP